MSIFCLAYPSWIGICDCCSYTVLLLETKDDGAQMQVLSAALEVRDPVSYKYYGKDPCCSHKLLGNDYHLAMTYMTKIDDLICYEWQSQSYSCTLTTCAI